MIAHDSASGCSSYRRWHQHIVVQIGYDPSCPGHHHEYDKQAEGKLQYVVGAVRPGGHVQEEHQVNAHLRNGERPRGPGLRRAARAVTCSHPEGRRCENERHQ